MAHAITIDLFQYAKNLKKAGFTEPGLVGQKPPKFRCPLSACACI
jgi:hypothetical protein